MNDLENILNIIIKINNKKSGNIFTDEEIKEQLENISDYKNTITKLNNILKSLEYIENESNKITMEKLCYLHLAIDDIKTYYEYIHDMIKKLISKYED